MPPKKKPDVLASKPVSPTRSQVSGERRAAAANQNSPPPPPPKKGAPDGAGDNIWSGEDAGGEKSTDGNTGKDPTVGEKSDGARTGKGQQATKSKSDTLLSADAQAHHDALVTTKALI